jgi:hypothetical protein
MIHDCFSRLLNHPHEGTRELIYRCDLDDVFKSTVHRASNPSGEERYSIPLFFGTDYDVRLEVSSLS